MARLSDKQFTVLRVLAEAEISARALRVRLDDEGLPMEQMPFYCFMHRQQRAGLVEVRYRSFSDERAAGRECMYRLTRAGKEACLALIGYYEAKAAETRQASWAFA